ncbi:unnamed protein product [Vitrella brassicaformis CCMP3155]|uniref:BTB domain-containing protein n=3 Tax=Vitrella brassicaformis TaxID=1169539 RepID=A0A0G4F8M9_VITBC|nr:unnamed protein product [Vitrella brassicaformis CCMP3155]|eukprot:CEM09102.1 unnamed protein product [Vitrella brassicaformis CCMP3155]
MAQKEDGYVKLIVGLKKEIFYEKKSLLVNVSPHFERMLHGDMACSERDTQTINLPNIHPNTFRHISTFATLHGIGDGCMLDQYMRSLPGALHIPAADQSDDEAAKAGLLHLWQMCNYLGMEKHADLLINRIMEHFNSPPLSPPSLPTPRSPLDAPYDVYPAQFPSISWGAQYYPIPAGTVHTYASQPAPPPSQPAPPPSYPAIGDRREAFQGGVLAFVLREKPALKNDEAIKNKVVGWVVYKTVKEGWKGQGAGESQGAVERETCDQEVQRVIDWSGGSATNMPEVQQLMGEMPAAWWQTVIDRLEDATYDIARRIGFLQCELERRGCPAGRGTAAGTMADPKKLQREHEETRLAAVREKLRVLRQQGGPAAGDA